MKIFPARIHILLASQATVGLIIRRGPSKQVATILWDRQCDRFQLGQWLKGRIYERRSDLSPDGKYLIYFAMNGRWQSEACGAWTAISQAPYLKAIAIFPKGDCWNGGGLWTSQATYWLNDGYYGHQILRDTSTVRRDTTYAPTCNYGNNECLGVYYPRLLRDGWQLVDRVQLDKWKAQHIFEKSIGNGWILLDKWKAQHIFEKSIGNGWILRKIAHAGPPPPEGGKACYWDEHSLVNRATNATISYPQWEWADLDGKRLVWAAEGNLYAAEITAEGLTNVVLLFDFNDMQFQPLAAPY